MGKNPFSPVFYALNPMSRVLPASKLQGNFIAAQEKYDVVHDQACVPSRADVGDEQAKASLEIKGYLSWLEGEIGVKVEDMTPKTKVQEYYKMQFDELLAVLSKNNRKLKIHRSSPLGTTGTASPKVI